MPDLDREFTFEDFVVGPANRLASAAARRAAETPGTAYNPLFVYSAPGLGKTHLMGAIMHQVAAIHPDKNVLYQLMEDYLVELSQALGKGTDKRFRERYAELDFVLLDDVQFLTGHHEAQATLLQIMDGMAGEGRQVVLASDRPPGEIEDLDARLRSRFEGGLLVEIGSPEYETQMAIIRKLTEARDQRLEPGVADVIGRSGVENVRELTGALNRVLSLQELEERTVTAAEAAAMLTEGQDLEGLDGSEMGQFLEELSDTVAARVDAQEAPWRKLLRDTVQEAEAEEFKTDSLRRLLKEERPVDDAGEVAEEFKRAIRELKKIKEELEEVGNPWPEAAFGVLKDPERLDEARALLLSARERARAFPAFPEGPDLEGLKKDFPKATLEAAAQLVKTDRPEYSPLVVWSPGGEAARTLLQATTRTTLDVGDPTAVALVSLTGFAEEFKQALSSGVAGAWRERWWALDFLFLRDLHDLSGTERAQDEVLHLLEALHRRKARVMVSADRPPSDLDHLDDRVRARLESGLVMEVPVPAAGLPPELLGAPDEPRQSGPEDLAAQDREWIRSFTTAAWSRGGGEFAAGAGGGVVEPVIPASAARSGAARPQGVWAPTRENVIWSVPTLENRIVKEPG